MNKIYNAIGLFSNLMGLEIGAHLAGFRNLFSTDIEEEIIKAFTFLKTDPHEAYIRADIKDLHFGTKPTEKSCDIQEILAENGEKINRGDIDLLMGGPVCFGMTLVNTNERSVFHDYNFLMLEMLRIVEEMQPKVVIMEQVPAIMTDPMRPFFYLVINAIEGLGNYEWACEKLDAQYYGCNQSRERVIFMLVRKDLGILPSYPKPNPVDVSKQSAYNTIGAEFVRSRAGYKKSTGGKQRIINGKKHVFPTLTSGQVDVFRNGKWGRLTLADRKILAHMNDFDMSCIFSESFLSERLGLMVLPPFAHAICKHILDNILSKANV